MASRDHILSSSSGPFFPSRGKASLFSASSLRLVEYFRLTKPSIVLLVAVTGVATMAAEGHLYAQPITMVLVLLLICLSAGSANALNQFIDRDIDSVMERTKRRRPLPQHRIEPREALIFGIAVGVVSNLLLWWVGNALAALLSVGTILFYVFVYTLWLKRRHHYNIVIGGAAGATAPLIACAAATGELSPLSWILFAVIFFWTPPHFWALALAIKDQYQKVGIPMLPNVRGDERTRFEIWIYTLFLLPLGALPFFTKDLGIFFLILSSGLWLWSFWKTYGALKEKTIGAYRKLFLVSIAYLFFYFIAAAVDGTWKYFWGS